jgi:hypothetical protein|nr:MAG TPA: putative transglutaminase-family protein [Caudoviricetes sp.]
MRKIGLFNIGKLGLVKSAGTGKTDINKVIQKWIPKHMVFWYDMSKPVDVYVPSVTYANQFVIEGGKITYDKAINKCTITHTPTSKNRIFWQTPCAPSSTIDSYRIRVTGLPKGFYIQSGYYSNKITADGEYDIDSYTNKTTSTMYPGFYLAGDNVADVDCNIVVEEIPTKQSVPTNEILKANPYLQDFSGNNRPLKLNNFLFAAMSGVGGYTDNFNDWSINSKTATVKLESSSSVTIQAITQEHVGVVYKYENGKRTIIKVNITGITEEIKGRFAFGYADVTGNHNIILENGYFEFDTDKYEGIVGWYGFKSMVPINICNITIEQIPSYPNALVTDGVDDYGQVQNLQQGVKVLFVTINPFIDGKFIYDQRLNTTEPWLFAVFNDKGSIAYNSRNSNGKTYIDGTLNESTIVSALLNKKQIITIVNNDVTGDKTKTPVFFSNTDHDSGWISSAFYNSFGFDSVPTKQNDGFTEQDLIDYYIPKAIVTITVVDVSGSPIQDAVVTVGGIQYKTLSDGTVKVRGMANSTMSLSVKKDGYMPFSDNSWKFTDSRITLEVLRNTVITENGYSILLENDGLILTE